MIFGIIREEKIPRDRRVALPPAHCHRLMQRYDRLKVIVEPSPWRCYSDDEYRAYGIEVSEDLSGCDILFGVKEVPIDRLIPGKTYFFFSHTIKKQPYNRDLLRAVLDKHITLVDYECLTRDADNERVIAFGRWAGIVGGHNTMMAWGNRTGRYRLGRMFTCRNYEEARKMYDGLDVGSVRIVITGNGRVSNGAAEVLRLMGIREITPERFLSASDGDDRVFTMLANRDMYYKPGAQAFDSDDYHAHPELYRSKFLPYTAVADVMINGIYWDARIPRFFTLEDMCRPEFRIQVIGDITCDIAPNASIPCTIRPSTIENPVYGFDPCRGVEVEPYTQGAVDVMAVDNLPNELPRDASDDFGNQMLQYVVPEIFNPASYMIERATIAKNGKLTPRYLYLKDWVEGTFTG